MTMNVLVVWEMIPESMTMYMIPMSEEEFKIVSKANGHIINVAEDISEESQYALDYLNLALTDKKYAEEKFNIKYAEEVSVPREVIGKWADLAIKYESSEAFIPTDKIDAIVSSGFYL